ncbi:MAG: molybdopterin-guanine dinucleotide biosynthesis protein B [Lachnospiraceae bacterium]|nr:molybdopterin-guanine dinucleotide biosynthesis protein B [Lachnospiraceae bacterium]
MTSVCAVCGVKNSGKTTLIEKLIREYAARGVRTAVIKHDGHDFTCDVPGTDSSRFYEAGAYGTAVFSDNRIFVHRQELRRKPDRAEWEKEKVRELVSLFPDADLILVEGLKNSSLPKIEVVRKEISDTPVSNPEGRFLVVTDLESGSFGEKVLGLEQIGEIADLLYPEKVKAENNP